MLEWIAWFSFHPMGLLAWFAGTSSFFVALMIVLEIAALKGKSDD